MASGEPYSISGMTVQFNGQVVPVTSATITGNLTWPDDAQCLGGHRTAEYLEYRDGLAVAYCEECNVRIVLGRVPGGFSGTVLRSLFEDVAGGDVSSDVLERFATLKEELRAEREACELAVERLRLVEILIEQQL